MRPARCTNASEQAIAADVMENYELAVQPVGELMPDYNESHVPEQSSVLAWLKDIFMYAVAVAELLAWFVFGLIVWLPYLFATLIIHMTMNIIASFTQGARRDFDELLPAFRFWFQGFDTVITAIRNRKKAPSTEASTPRLYPLPVVLARRRIRYHEVIPYYCRGRGMAISILVSVFTNHIIIAPKQLCLGA